MGVTRFFRHGELPLVILALLARRPMHRYQLLVELDRMFGDAYEPSTGTVYPATTALEEERLVTATRKGRRVVYALTDLGRSVLADRRSQLAELELRTGAQILADGEVPVAVDRFVALARSLAPVVGAEAVAAVVDRAVEELSRLSQSKGKAG